MNQASERRQFWRTVFHSPVRFSIGADKLQAQLLDISLKGALLELAQPWTGAAAGKGILQFDLGEGASIAMQTSVAYASGKHLGLHCDSIDLDSITHLRRLVALNSGADGILDRELANLLADSPAPT